MFRSVRSLLFMKINHLAFGIFVPPWLRKNMHTHAHTYEHTYIHYSLPFPNLFICPNFCFFFIFPSVTSATHIFPAKPEVDGERERLYIHIYALLSFLSKLKLHISNVYRHELITHVQT